VKALVALWILLQVADVAGRDPQPGVPVLVPVDRTVYLYSVTDAGGIQKLPFQFARNYYGTVGLGDSGPLISPDKRWVAFIRSKDVRGDPHN
jgi:hypothetical protein